MACLLKMNFVFATLLNISRLYLASNRPIPSGATTACTSRTTVYLKHVAEENTARQVIHLPHL